MPIEDVSNSPLYMDRSLPLGNSQDTFSRRALHVKIGNSNAEPIPIAITAESASDADLSQVIATGSTQVLLAANPDRKAFVILNLTTKPAYVALAPTSTTSLFSYLVLPFATLESNEVIYKGVISVICDGTGAFQITELT